MSKPMRDDDIDNIEAAAQRKTDGYPFAHPADTLLLVDEIRRLKSGDFTEEEFQNFCHHFSAIDHDRFAAACLEYHKKLFGEKVCESSSTEP